jgi:hypothetical protein
MSERMNCVITADTPGANSNETTLFDSTTAMYVGALPIFNVSRAVFSVKSHYAGTARAYYRTNANTTWEQYQSDAVAAHSSGDGNVTTKDYDLCEFNNWKLTWVNGGSSQTTCWKPDLVLLIGDRTPGA